MNINIKQICNTNKCVQIRLRMIITPFRYCCRIFM